MPRYSALRSKPSIGSRTRSMTIWSARHCVRASTNSGAWLPTTMTSEQTTTSSIVLQSSEDRCGIWCSMYSLLAPTRRAKRRVLVVDAQRKSFAQKRFSQNHDPALAKVVCPGLETESQQADLGPAG